MCSIWRKYIRDAGTITHCRWFNIAIQNKEHIMRGVLLWLVGIPIPIIILLYLFNVV